ncbi:MAG TPA: hypothetical protein VHM65_07280 [Candidatus Lustribacter sp.]|nr:hypothetical protein [Candidatus Lustribacter sp.]
MLPLLVAVGFGAVAVLLGSPVTMWLFRRVDRSEGTGAAHTVTGAAAVLRGGMWIGYLERGATFASILLGWPEGIALAIAIKGLGRYEELRSSTTGAAERFIIGTFASLLFACLWAVAAREVIALV